MQIFRLFQYVSLTISLPCLNSFSDYRMKPELHIRTPKISHNLALEYLFTSCHLATPYSPVLLGVDLALKVLNVPLSLTKLY